MDIRRGESADVLISVELNISSNDTFIADASYQAELALEELAVLDRILRTVVDLIRRLDGRVGIRRVELHAHDARRDAAHAEHGVGLGFCGQFIVLLSDGIARLEDPVRHELAVFRHVALTIAQYVGIGRARGLVEELRRQRIDREVDTIVLEHLRRILVRDVQLGAKLLLLLRQRLSACRRCGKRSGAVVDLAVAIRLQLDLLRRDACLQGGAVVRVGIGRGVAQADFRAARVLRKLPILIALAFSLIRPCLVAVDALEFVDDVFIQRIRRIGTVFHIGVALAVVGMSAREVLVVRTVALVVALLVAVEGVVELDGRFARTEIHRKLELVVEGLAIAIRRIERLAIDLGERVAVVRLGEIRTVPLPRLLERERQGLDDARAVDGVVAVVEVIVRDGTGRLQTSKGILDTLQLDIARLGRAVQIARRALDMLVDIRVLRRIEEGALHGAITVAAGNLPGKAIGVRIRRITEVEEIAIFLGDAVELQPLLHGIRDIGIAVVVLVETVRAEGQLLLPDIAETLERMALAHTGIDERLRRICLQSIARRIDDADLERIVLVRHLILETHLVGDGLVRRRERSLVVRVTVRVGILVFTRRLKIELLTVGKATVLVAADLAVAVERDDLLPVEVRIVFDELARLLVLRIVAVLDVPHIGVVLAVLRANVLRTVVDLLHEMERQRHAAARDLAAADVRGRAVRVRHLLAAIVLAEVVDAVGAERGARDTRIIEITVVQGELELDILALADILRRRVSRLREVVGTLDCVVLHIDCLVVVVLVLVRRPNVVDIGLGRRRFDVRRAIIVLANRIGLEADLERTAREMALRDVTRTEQLVGFAARRRELRAVVRQVVVRCLRRLRPRADNLDVLVFDVDAAALRVDVGILIFRRIASCACAVQIAAFAALPAACDVEKRLGLLDRLRAVILLRGMGRRQIERRTVDLVVRRRKAEIRPRRFVVNDGIGIHCIVDNVVVRIIRAVGILAVDLERVVHALVRRIGSISGIGTRISRRRLIRAVARKKTRVLVIVRALAEAYERFTFSLRAADQHLRAGIVRLFAHARDLGIDLAPFDIARRRQRLRCRACERIEGVVVRSIACEHRRIGDLARVRRRCTRVDRRRRLVERRCRRQLVLIRLNKVQNGKVRLVRRLRAVVDLADVRTMSEICLQQTLFDVTLRIAVVGAIGEHLVAIGVRRIEVAGEFEVVLRRIRELEVEQHLLVLPHVLVIRRISCIAVRRRLDLLDVNVEETVVAAIRNIAVRDIAFPSRGIFRITVDIRRAVVRLLDRLRAEIQLEVRLRDLERCDLAVAEHRIARRIVARERLAIGISEIVVRCIRARELDAAVFDVVLLRFGSLRRVLRFVDTRICIVEVDRIRRATVIGLLRAIVRRQADARRGGYTSYLDDIRVIERLRDIRGSRELERTLFNRVRRRRDHIVARSGGNSRPCPAIIKRIVIRNRCIRID